MKAARVVLAAILVFGGLAVTEIAEAEPPLKLVATVRLSSVNNFNDSSHPLEGGCQPASGFTIPSGKAFAIYDIRCRVGLGLVPPPNAETFWLGLVDGANCSGLSVYDATFGSVEGLRDSPTLPRVVKDRLTVVVKRTAALNGEGPTEMVQVVCDFAGVIAIP